MTGQLDGKIALVTGASRGIGKAIAEIFAAQGATVVLSYRSGTDEAAAVVSGIEAHGGKAIAIAADVANEQQIVALYEAVDAIGPLDILVNNAGVILEKPLLDTTADDFDWLMNVNLRGQFLVGREALRRMVGRDGTRVINISSDLSFTGREDFSAYCASKGAINALTKSWAREFAPHVLVNAIAPGPIDTDMLDLENMSAEWAEKEKELTVLKRIGTVDEISAVALFLAGPGSTYLSGQIIGPNGGSVMP
ncbi:SDR family NAD(P)-dependent oxidoreductase [Magnetovibrio sp.]|uniref:SDR family NAD(P)-dependent oxidoreductase n=1 Tax=Magnetovibrio sp. TaxID=2024836 RepID=UPI002F92C62A